MDARVSGFWPEPVILENPRPANQSRRDVKAPKASFNELLQRELGNVTLKLSAHAEKRLRERNITLNDADMEKISRAVNLAASKGVRNSLVIYHDLALVTSVQNRTVVTALDRHSETGRVFTNIDGAVIVE
ncbi:MAG: TIGR02530 family flagellar biosynthesis protein [Desulfofundulus sp.]|uniref:TIGR02530 family flagellar biosynthesis protein n=1 Tax=Desulfofundulus sp. TaxID=2282750 RepID=UPI003C776C26